MRILTVLTFISFLAITSTSAQTISENNSVQEKLAIAKAWLDAQIQYEEIPGVSAAIIHDQELVWSGGYGMANPEAGISSTSSTINSICSISKLFTSISIMQLKEQGKLRLDDPISKHLKWFPDLEQQYQGAPEITIENILTHSAGLPRESDHSYWSVEFDFPKKDEIIEGLQKQETLYEPWQYFQYSNLGLTLAGQIVEEVSGMSYEDYVQEKILSPLEMGNTLPYMPKDKHGKELAVGYTSMTRFGEREKMDFFEANGINPAAGFSSTVDDLGKFASWQFATYSGNGNEVLQTNTLKEMYRVHYMDPNWRTSWGIGFSVRQMDGKTMVGHGGSCPGYRSQLLIDPKSKIAVVFMANASGVNTAKFTNGLYRLLASDMTSAAKSNGNDQDEDEDEDENGNDIPDFSRFEGIYDVQPWSGEDQIFQVGKNLVSVGLPTDSPNNFTKYKHIEGNKFRRIRSDDNLGEVVEFKEDANGNIIGYSVFSNYYPKINPIKPQSRK